MPRKPRITYAGAHYHITSRGNNKKVIFKSDEDFITFISILSVTIVRFDWVCYSYCLMNNHYHLCIMTPADNISIGMKFLNYEFAKAFNSKYKSVGHVFQNRFHSVLINTDQQRLNVARYIVLNPVRAGLVKNAAEWKWSSVRATLGIDAMPDWLSGTTVLRYFSDNNVEPHQSYNQFISEGIGLSSPFKVPSIKAL